MTIRPNPKQALLLWRMLTATSADDRSPMQSKARPELTLAERAELVRGGFLELDKQKRGTRLVLTGRAWAWASSDSDVELLKSSSAIGAIALEGLLRRLIPFLQARGIELDEVLPEPDATPAAPQLAATKKSSSNRALSPPRASLKKEHQNRQERHVASPTEQSSVEHQVERTCRELNAQKPNAAIRLARLRAQLPGVPRLAVDAELQRLHAAGRIALYRDDNSAAVTPDDVQAAFSVGGEPRHLLYWKE